MDSGRPEDIDVLGEQMTSADITRWAAYFQARYELELEAMNTEPVSAPASSRRHGFVELDESGIRAIFAAHTARERAA